MAAIWEWAADIPGSYLSSSNPGNRTLTQVPLEIPSLSSSLLAVDSNTISLASPSGITRDPSRITCNYPCFQRQVIFNCRQALTWRQGMLSPMQLNYAQSHNVDANIRAGSW